MQTGVLIVSLSLIALVGAVFAWIAVRGTSRSEDAADKSVVERGRVLLIWAFAVIGFLITYVSLRPWPHDAHAANGTVTVDVIGSQWSWEISTREVPLDTPVVFNVESHDVNHGIGIYDPSGTLLFQTQAMPGVTNRVKYTFTKPGTYRVLCMEYCGLVHHGMTDEFTVVQN